MLTGPAASNFEEVLVIEATFLTIGTESPKGEMVPIIRHNVSIPVTRMEVFSTSEDNQSKVSRPIFEGENRRHGRTKPLVHLRLPASRLRLVRFPSSKSTLTLILAGF